MITFILTTYNRADELAALLRSLAAQTSQDFETIIVDDNSSDPRVEQVIQEYFKSEQKGAYAKSTVQDSERKNSVRYAVNINYILGLGDQVIHGNLIAYLCDDVELAPTYVETVQKHFAEQPDHDAGYVSEEWTENGKRVNLLWYAHPMAQAFCLLDHSQVVHRKACMQMWGATHPLAWRFADGIFFERLLGRVGLIYPIGDATPLVNNKILSTSVCRQDVETALEKLKESV